MTDANERISRPGRAACVAGLALALVLLAGCQAIFTYSPVAFLQRPAAGLSPAQQVTYGQDALASGDPAKMTEAYTLLAADTTNAEAQYVAAQLGTELSGVPTLLTGMLDGSVAVPASGDASTITTFITENNLSPDYLEKAAENLQNAQALGQPLEPMDYVMGGLGLALAAADKGDGTFDFAAADPVKQAEAQAFITQPGFTEAVKTIPALADFQSYLDSLLPA